MLGKGSRASKRKQEMRKNNNAVAIPEVAEKHIRIECGKVARRFHLNEDDREELESHVGCEVRLAVARGYDPRKGLEKRLDVVR